MSTWALWLILSGIFLLIEIFTVTFLMFWPGIGALLAFVACVLGASFGVQVAVFAISTIILILFMKPLINKLFKQNNSTPMNSNSNIGKEALVIKEIDNINSTGQVKLNGELWSAVSSNNVTINEGETVKVTGIDGVKLIVEKIAKEN